MEEHQPGHDEINLVRLLRRIEKSVANQEDWKPSATQLPEIWLRARKELQTVRHARILVKNIELSEFDPTPERISRLNDIKIRLDRVSTFLENVEQPKLQRAAPILPTLPLPVSPPAPKIPRESVDQSHSPAPYLSPLPSVLTKGLFINPPDLDDISPTLITSALPSLLPSNPSEMALASSYSRNFGPTPTNRRLQVGGNHTTTALQEELSSQLETMAKQFKRNAIHLSNLLEKDKEVVEDAQLKLEVNHDVMQKERVRLRDHTSKNRWTMCFTLGIVLAVLMVFMLMVSVIRFS